MKYTTNYHHASEHFSTKTCFAKIAEKKLNKKEKLVLDFFYQNKPKSKISQTVKDLVSQINCSESSVWSTLKSLRYFGLVVLDKEGTLHLSRPAKEFARSIGE